MEHEIWKEIPGYEGIYQASTYGRIKSLPKVVKGRTFKEKMLSFSIGGRGYYYVNLRIRGVAKRCTVHRVIAETFLDKEKGKDYVDHINTDKLDNRVTNLKWVTAKENSNNPLTIAHQRQMAVQNAKRGGSSIYAKKVYQFNLFKVKIAEYPSTLEAAEAVGVKRQNIQSCIYGTQMICADSLWSLSPVYKPKTEWREKYLLKYIAQKGNN